VQAIAMNDSSERKWGQGKLLAANKRRRIASEPAVHDWDGEFDDVDHAEENPFDSIDRLLNQREQKKKQLDDEKQEESNKESTDYNEPSFSQCSDPAFSQHEHGQNHEHYNAPSPKRGDITITNKPVDDNETLNQHFFGPNAEQQDKLQAQQSTKKRQYSIIKSSTPRFTFQSTIKKSSLQTPSTQMQSLPNRTLFSTQTTQKSTKLTTRHSFRKSLDKPQPVKDVRSLECTPSFLSKGKRKKEGINPSPDSTIPADAPVSTFASLRSSLIHDTTKPQSSRGGNKAGYLIQRMRSLRSNDQRMAMRLRSGQLTMRKLRRSGGGGTEFDARHSAKSELDVTVSCIAREFGEGRSVVLGHIHRYEGVNGGAVNDSTLKLPTFAWILLSNDVIREQGIAQGVSKQLRFYDAVMIPKRVPNASLQNVEHLDLELTLPTVACGSVCEQYSAEHALSAVSFDIFQRSV
jgi:hypothetical protein